MAASKRPDRKEEQEGDIAVGLQTVAHPEGRDVMSGASAGYPDGVTGHLHTEGGGPRGYPTHC